MRNKSRQENINPTEDYAGVQPPTPVGQLWGVSVGPGDPELITLKGLRQLQRSPVVAFPAGRPGQLGMAERIVQPWLQPQQQRLPLQFPYTRDETVLTAAWQRAATQVAAQLKAGRDVCFVSEGDVSLYSTFSYLAQFVRQQLAAPVQAIPGVCSPLAAAAALGVPLTLQHQKLLVIPALYSLAEGTHELDQALDSAEVVVLMKIASVYKKVWSVLKTRNLLENSYVIEQATGSEQRVYQGLGDRPELTLAYFSLLVVHTQPLFSQSTFPPVDSQRRNL